MRNCSVVADTGTVTFVVKSAQSQYSQKRMLLDIVERHDAQSFVFVMF